jgi:K+-transporting ATPase ATPase C chain
MKTLFRPAVTLFVLLSLLTGVAYPLLVTGLARSLWADAADGSLVSVNGHVVGSRLIGQPFADAGHFWSRPSATGPMAYNAAASSGSNLGPLNPALTDAVKARVEALRSADPGQKLPVPVDLVTASASGLDPDISKAAADHQVARVAHARGLSPSQVQAVVNAQVIRPWLGFLGEPRVNVLALNLALDQVRP